MLKGSSGQPDILILEANVSPVVIETEVLPAVTVESEATNRLGHSIKATGRRILSAIAVRLPVALRSKSGSALETAVKEETGFEMAMFTGSSPTSFQRWPPTGWIRGNVTDLSVLAQSASLPPEVVEKAADQLTEGVNEAASLMAEMAESNQGAIHKISQELLQEDGEQTRRMAATIMANAFVFHGSLAGGIGDLEQVKTTEELRKADGSLNKSAILAEWRKILQINYWPIFDIARRILEVIPTAHSKILIERLAATADRLLESRLMRSHDLTGHVFQKLIADRKFLAAYYTTPASAALLVGLSISADKLLSGVPWGDVNGLIKLRVADFACGTGTLLSAAYQRIGQMHELAGGDSEAIHPDMMAHVLVGCDVLPAAAHLTASMLSGAHPTIKYEDSQILTVRYGRQPEGDLRLGSLDLLDEQGRVQNVAITAKALKGKGQAEKETWWTLAHNSFDFVIMNPPFTRDTGHEGKKIGVANPMFAAFEASEDDQREMATLLKELTKGSNAHGNAGEASIFLALANRKLKNGGALALVLPLSFLSGEAWEGSRVLLARHFTDVVLVSIAGAADDESSFSADTDMAECLVVARKNTAREKEQRATFVILKERPASQMLGSVAARQILELISKKTLRAIEDGPVGGSPIYFGRSIIGHAVTAPTGLADARTTSRPWHTSRLGDVAVGQAAYQLADCRRVWLPGMAKSEAVSIPITKIAATKAVIGPYHADINGMNSNGTVRGPFDKIDLIPGAVPTYPMLWSHDAAHQQSIIFGPDSEGIARKAKAGQSQSVIDQKVIDVWATASHCHFNRDFRFNSQSTSMQYTTRLAIGGRAWTSIKMKSDDEEKVLVLWSNTSLGLMMYWWHANKQQSGRGSIGVSALGTLPVLDVASLSDKQMKTATQIFNDVGHLNLLPFHRIDSDPVRRQIDERFGGDVLGLPKSLFAEQGVFDLCRQKLAAEPSIRGNKTDGV